MRVALRLAPLGASCEVETWFVGVPAAAAAPPPPPPRKRRGEEEEEEEEDGPSRRPRPGFCPPFAGAGPAAQSGAVAAGALPPVAAVPNPLFTSCHRAQARLRGDVVRRLTANPPSRISCVQDQKESDGRAWSSEEAALT